LDLARRRALRAGRLRLPFRPPPAHRRAQARPYRGPARRMTAMPVRSNHLLYLLPLMTLAILAGFFGWSLVSERDPASIGSALVGKPAPPPKAPAPAPAQGGPSHALRHPGQAAPG